MSIPQDSNKQKRELDIELDIFEKDIAGLKVAYEQYFSGFLPQPPDKAHQEVKFAIKRLLRAPFKNSASKFRLQTLMNRYHTYATHWERILKQKEQGVYCRDTFKAAMKEKFINEDIRKKSKLGKAEAGIKQLFDCYVEALKSQGNKDTTVSFESFKTNIAKKTEELKKLHGDKKISLKIATKDGRVVIQAGVKET